jgi:hypothetical protein
LLSEATRGAVVDETELRRGFSLDGIAVNKKGLMSTHARTRLQTQALSHTYVASVRHVVVAARAVLCHRQQQQRARTQVCCRHCAHSTLTMRVVLLSTQLECERLVCLTMSARTHRAWAWAVTVRPGVPARVAHVVTHNDTRNNTPQLRL